MTDSGNLYVGSWREPDKYRLKRQMGAGGEALLWEGEIEVAGVWEPVAVKILRAQKEADLERWRGRWADQAEVLRFIRHPGVVGVREHFEGGGMHYRGEEPSAPGGLFLTMNWVAGPTLREWVTSHPNRPDQYEEFTYLTQIGDVLDWLHSGNATPSRRPVIHADVTPNNVIVTPAGQAVLVDFGLARLTAGLSSAIEGTGGYLAPEVTAAGAYSPASDRYAFGALTYFVLTGIAAPAGLPAIRSGLTAVPSVAAQPGLIEHLMRMFDPDPRVRPACGEWIRRFTAEGATLVAAASKSTVVPTPGTVAMPPLATVPRRRRKLAVVVAAVLLAVGAGAIAIAASGTTDTPSGTGDTVDQEGVPTTSVATTSATTTPVTTTPPVSTPVSTTETDFLPPPSTTTPPPAEFTQPTTFAGQPRVAITTPPVASVPVCFPNCSGQNLTAANLSGLDLSGGDFRNANLLTANFVNTNVSSADFSGANLIGINARGANFSGAYLSAYSMTGAVFSGADLSYADLRKAYALSADFTNADMRNADLTSAYLERTVFANADLSGANLSATNTFGTGDVSGAILTGTIMPDGTIHA